MWRTTLAVVGVVVLWGCGLGDDDCTYKCEPSWEEDNE